jgi:hypothetical protein
VVSRSLGSTVRPFAVWSGASTAAVLALASVRPAWAAAGSASGATAVSDVVVAVCATGLALALVWLWLVTTVTVLGMLSGRTVQGGATRRLVLLACGVAVAAGANAAPALAVGGDGSELLAGLSLPERAVAPHRQHAQHAEPRPAAPSPAGTYVVRPGDSLSSIALAHPGAGSLDDRWRALWRANRDVVGDDPDLIHPGQALRLPGTRHDSQANPDEDGDRS